MIIHFMGSKRTGPDLLRVGGKYNDSWHFNHMWSPQSTSSDRSCRVINGYLIMNLRYFRYEAK
jgi:cbb3-type cytochrome oxidase cytochrome c subunit